jgi:prefoldin subunit 5
MFISKKEFETLKNKVEQQEQLLQQMMYHINQLAQEINELKKPKEPNYFS